MNKNQLPIIIYLALGLQLSVELNPSVAQAETPTTLDVLPEPIVIGRPPDQTGAGTNAQLPKPRVIGIPPKPSRKAAGTRGSCEETTLPFTPVLPDPDPEFSGLTLSSYPTFWFYVPYQSDRVKLGKFSLETSDGLRIWRSDFKLPPTPGFVSITLPKTAKALDEGETYKWHFTLYCNTEEDSESNQELGSVSHQGLIKRAKNIPSPLSSSLDFYLKHKIWYDAGDRLAEIRQSPQDWNLFLSTMKMSAWRDEKVSGALYSTLR
ncbi:DUF928 domain-containing protein [Merismopedia glauca]|uniref:DUF928 domain-containing protein n=1 Tax=Merismopedia glauca CCAP 1448/3 TaxID=1296344 RepID=A0A2T1C8R4_9CYAN|nr:DUF928 domain-containing protein [Merismopedia glauca]PSB04537.1 hypothetical protein C7B64_03715 [Merismopedia glauca CCAP 1448/3]